ncbi:MAG: ABC transporter permease [Gordonia sp. (in: high G+C Gram-positive bacteria)]|uniref:ABC transporter permease n=1 Tax=Gordonia sp. (in: high G+C Gram-positive bacteria) TaxID=84139 RepID=UPI0039E335AE
MTTTTPVTAEPVAPPGWFTAQNMRRTAAQIVSGLGVLAAAATVAWLAQIAIPGDRATAILNIRAGTQQTYTPEQLAEVDKAFGFDTPLVAQWLTYVTGLLHGDLGTSYSQFKPVTEIIGNQLAPSLVLTVSALVVAWIIAVVVSLSTVRRGRLRDGLGTAFEAFTASLPQYWVGVILLVIFAVKIPIFPVIGGDGAWGSVLPILTLAIPLSGFLGQVIRDEFEKVLDQPFITTARTRGLSETAVRLGHGLRHAVVPAVSLSGWALGALISGAVIVENVFGRPGVGQILVTAVNTRDIPTVSGVVVLIAAIYIVANILVDVVYSIIDPRLGES